MGAFLFGSAPLASVHAPCSLSDTVSPHCLRMLYSEDFFLSESAPPQVYLFHIVFFPLFFLFFLFRKALKSLAVNFPEESIKSNNGNFREFLIEHELSRKRSLIRISHTIISHFVLQRQYTQKKTHIVHFGMGSIDCSGSSRGINT